MLVSSKRGTAGSVRAALARSGAPFAALSGYNADLGQQDPRKLARVCS